MAGNNYKTHIENLKRLSFDIGMYRPPSEGGSFSLLLRFTRNCPWNKCTFCEMYKGEKFVYRSVDEIKADIDSVKTIIDEITAISWKLGHGGRANRDVAVAILGSDASFYTNHCFISVFEWLASGGRTAFLQDANSMIMRPPEFVEVLKYLRGKLPTLTRVTTYARSKTLAQRKPEQLKEIHDAGLTRLHVGLETGDDELLEIVRKGVTSEEQIEGGEKAMEAGFQLSEYWMPDLGGRERWRQHAENTARVLTAINPHYIRSRPFVPRMGTPIYEEYERGNLHLSSPHERLEEVHLMIENLNVTSRVCFDHAMNAWLDRRGGLLFRQDYEGYKFPEERPLVLERIQEGLDVSESTHTHVRDVIGIRSL
ncbi:MAG: radical SAM protein [Deltaproteobacteria bacterium]|nr:radical SAM protein [Deltaproteobacteria bacterium]